MIGVCSYSNPSNSVSHAKFFPYLDYYNNSSVLMPEIKKRSFEPKKRIGHNKIGKKGNVSFSETSKNLGCTPTMFEYSKNGSEISTAFLEGVEDVPKFIGELKDNLSITLTPKRKTRKRFHLNREKGVPNYIDQSRLI